MKLYIERLDIITREFAIFAGFAVLEERFRALNNNDGADDDVNGVTYGFATSGMAVCGARLLYELGSLLHAVYHDGKNYFYPDQNSNQLMVQPDPLAQLEDGLQGARNLSQSYVDRIKALETALERKQQELEKQTSRSTRKITELENENASLKRSFTIQSNANINLTK